jgi:DNA-directed RNA polymerase subunit RPC12/RpoP
MNWQRRTVEGVCAGCALLIHPGEPARLLTKRKGVFCAACAARRLLEQPPTDMPTQAAKSARIYVGDGRSVAPGFSGFNRPEAAGTVRQAILDRRALSLVDSRARQVGSE